jgi:hypothetical protein
MKLSEIIDIIVFWRKWTRKIDKPFLTDEDLDAMEEELHIHEPAGKVYKYKKNKYGH